MFERIRFRSAHPPDGPDQAEIFYHAVMEGAAGNYSLAQRQVWASALPRTAEAWVARQALYPTLVADCDGHCVGFCERDITAARIETLYVWPSLTRQGIGARLLTLALGAFESEGAREITIEASLTLAPGLENRGWTREAQEWVEWRGQKLPRVRLRRMLSARWPE